MNKRTFMLAPGKYFIGDVSYFLTDEYYESVKENLINYTGSHRINGDKSLTLISTKRGSWYGSDRELYDVNSGTLGVCSFDLGDFIGSGTIYDFHDSVYVDISRDGVLSISSGAVDLVIDTNCEPVPDFVDDGYDSCG